MKELTESWQIISETKTKKNKKKKESQKLAQKIDPANIEKAAILITKIFLLRHKVKMIWFSINCFEGDDVENSEFLKGDENDEARREAQLQRKIKLRELAKQRTETLDLFIEKLTTDAKQKEFLMAPVRVVQERRMPRLSANFYHRVVTEMPKDFVKHVIIDRLTKKAVIKKIEEILERDQSQAQIFKDFLNSYKVKRSV